LPASEPGKGHESPGGARLGSFRRVEAEQAGLDALGILIPPARRTFVILRPRALPWDLLLSRQEDLAFRDLAHDEASAAAQGLYRALRDWVAGGPGSIDVLAADNGFRLVARIGPFLLVACPRRPGQPYAALVCAESDARAAAERLGPILCPPADAEQEVYFNMRFFERPTD
jgi:hypothetical protein